MPLQSSGQISLDDLHVEAGGTSGTECSMNDSDIRGLIGMSSASQAAMNAFYGASSGQFLIPKNNGSGNYTNLTRTSGSTTYTETGFIGSSNLTQSTSPYASTWSANQGSLSSTAFPGGNTIAGMVFFANPGGTQVYIWINGGTSNSGWNSLSLSAYGTAYGPTGGYSWSLQTRNWTTTFNRSSGGFSTSSPNSSVWTRYYYWANSGTFAYSGDPVFSTITASLSSTHTGNGISLAFT